MDSEYAERSCREEPVGRPGDAGLPLFKIAPISLSSCHQISSDTRRYIVDVVALNKIQHGYMPIYVLRRDNGLLISEDHRYFGLSTDHISHFFIFLSTDARLRTFERDYAA